MRFCLEMLLAAVLRVEPVCTILSLSPLSQGAGRSLQPLPPPLPPEYPPQHAGAQSHTAAEPGPGKQAICSSLKQRLITAFESPITCHTMRRGISLFNTLPAPHDGGPGCDHTAPQYCLLHSAHFTQ